MNTSKNIALKKLHIQINKEYDAESLALEEEYNSRRAALVEARQRDHLALDRRWTEGKVSEELNNMDNAKPDWQPFQAPEVVQKIIANQAAEDKITVDRVYQDAIQLDPKLKERKPPVIRTQISRELLKLVDLGKLEFVRKGKGGQPHIYRRVAGQAVAAGAAGQ